MIRYRECLAGAIARMERDNRAGDGPQNTQTEHYRESAAIKVAFLTGVTFFSMFAGIGLKLGLAGRRYRRSLRTKPEEEGLEDPVLLAARALGWGTGYAVGGTGAVVLLSAGVWKLVSSGCVY